MKELHREWGIMMNDGSIFRSFSGRTAEGRTRAYGEYLAKVYAPDRIRVVSRPIYAGEWEEA